MDERQERKAPWVRAKEQEDSDKERDHVIDCTECSWYRNYSDPSEPMDHYCPECGADVELIWEK